MGWFAAPIAASGAAIHLMGWFAAPIPATGAVIHLLRLFAGVSWLLAAQRRWLTAG